MGNKLTSMKYELSDELAAIVGVGVATRPTVVKKLWAYIKRHELQGTDDGDRRTIYPDDRLAEVFGAKKFDMFKMNKMLGEHLTKV